MDAQPENRVPEFVGAVMIALRETDHSKVGAAAPEVPQRFKARLFVIIVHEFRRRGMFHPCPIYIGGLGLASLQSMADRPIDLAGATDIHDVNTRISEFVCQAQHPTDAQLREMLSPAEADVLYSYYVDSLQPCLLLNAGVVPQRPPSRTSFVSTYTGTSWSPYDASATPDTVVDNSGNLRHTALGARCPRFPSWVTGG